MAQARLRKVCGQGRGIKVQESALGQWQRLALGFIGRTTVRAFPSLICCPRTLDGHFGVASCVESGCESRACGRSNRTDICDLPRALAPFSALVMSTGHTG